MITIDKNGSGRRVLARYSFCDASSGDQASQL
jgi:hypothetical protein